MHMAKDYPDLMIKFEKLGIILRSNLNFLLMQLGIFRIDDYFFIATVKMRIKI